MKLFRIVDRWRISLLHRQAVTLAEQKKFAEAFQAAQHMQAIARHSWGSTHLVYATGLYNSAAIYEQACRYAQAEEFYREALSIRQRQLGMDHSEVIASLKSLANIYRELCQDTKAEEILEQLLNRFRLDQPTPFADVAECLNNLGLISLDKGAYARAEALLLQAKEIAVEHLGEGHPDTATALNNLASVYKMQGRYDEALALCDQSLNIKVQALGENDRAVIIGLNDLAAIYLTKGAYPEARALMTRAIDLCAGRVSKLDSSIVFTTLDHFAELCVAEGDFSLAQNLYEEIVAARTNLLGKSHPELATDLNNLGIFYTSVGKFDRALPLLQNALALRTEGYGKQHPATAASLNVLAVFYNMIGDYPQAKDLLEQAIVIGDSIYGGDHPQMAVYINNLALLHTSLKKYAQAKIQLQHGLDIARAAYGEEHPDIATYLNNLGRTYESLREYTQAQRCYEQTLHIRQKMLGGNHPMIAAALNNLAMIYHASGDFEQSHALLLQSLDVKKIILGEMHPSFVAGVMNLAVIEMALGRKAAALAHMKEALAAQDQVIGTIFATVSEEQRLSYLAMERGQIDLFLSLLLHGFSHTPETFLDGFAAVLRRKAIGAEALITQRDALVRNRYPALASALAELRALRTQIAQKVLAGPGQESAEEHEQDIARLLQQRKRLEELLARQIPEMNLTHSLGQFTPQEVAGALPEGASLVEFVRFRRYNFSARLTHDEDEWGLYGYLAFVLSGQKPDALQLIDLGEAEPIDTLIHTFISALTQQATVSRHMKSGIALTDMPLWRNPGKELRRRIFDPLQAALSGCKRCFLAPDGDLARLPFETLPAEGDGFVMEQHQISYLSTGRDLLHLKEASCGSSTSPLVVADPDFDLNTFQDAQPPATHKPPVGHLSRNLRETAFPFKPLPGSREEGNHIAALLHVKPLLAEEAVEASIKAVHSPFILHLATHGFFLPDPSAPSWKQEIEIAPQRKPTQGRLERLFQDHHENPLLRSGLALAGANTWNAGGSLPPEAEDGLLTAEDVATLDLIDTQLVVLSACETGLGAIRLGEGVFGLRRAFVIAGARALVMSLWKVPDIQTKELMQTLYRLLLEGAAGPEALQAAKNEIKAKYSHPLYWGAFIWQGDPGPLHVTPPIASGASDSLSAT